MKNEVKCSNRTFMELKFYISVLYILHTKF